MIKQDLKNAWISLSKKYPDALGIFVVQCIDMSSSLYGNNWIIPYGPNNTFKDIPLPDQVILTHGSPSSASKLIGSVSKEYINNV